MPLINLIQEELQQRRRLQARARLLFHGFVASVLLGIGLNGLLFLRSESVSDEKKRLEAEIKRLEPLEKSIKDNEKQLAVIEPKSDQLVKARESTDRWLNVVDRLARSMPGDAWLTQVRSSQTDTKKPATIRVTGMASSQASVGLIMQNLIAFEGFDKVELRSTQEREFEGRRGIEFEFNVEVAGTADTQVKEKSSGDEDEKDA